MKDATIVLDIGNELFRVDGSRLSRVDNVSEIKGDKWIVSELDGALPRVLTVDAAVEHSEVVIEKRLRDIGELEGVGRVLSHHKRKIGPNSSETFFTAIPSELFNTFSTAEQIDDDHQLLFAFNTLLGLAVEMAKPVRPMAVLIEHGPHVSLLVADKRVIYGADRITLFDKSGGTETLLEGLTNSLRSIEQNSHIKIDAIHYYRWLSLDAEPTDWLDTLAANLDTALRRSADKNVEIDNRRATSSLLDLVNSLTAARSSSDPEVRNRYRAKEAMPWTFVVLGGLCAIALLTGLFFQTKAMGFQSDIDNIRAGIAAGAQRRMALELAIERDRDREMVDLAVSGPLVMADTLRSASKTPSLLRIVGEVSGATKGRVGFDLLKVTFPEDRIALKLEGRIAKASEDGMSHYNAFVAGLTQKGYSIKNSKLDTRDDALTLSLELERGIREK